MKSFRWIAQGLLLVLPLVSGCTGVNTFGTAARAGDTVVMALGWNLELSRAGIDYITITDAAGGSLVLTPDDPSVRSVFNAYPDPVSRLLVDAEKGNPSLMSMLIEGSVTAGDKEYSETMLMLDLPQGLSPGEASIVLTMTNGEVLGPVRVVVLPGTGGAAAFENQEHLSVGANHLRALERAPHYTVSFTGDVLPYGIQVDLVHDPDATAAGAGLPHVVNPRGDVKNLSWFGDGTSLRVVLLPTRERVPSSLAQFKFYVAGGITGLEVVDVRGFDVDGHPVAGIVAGID